MLFGEGKRRKFTDWCSAATRFCTDRRGVAAIEFAFLAPVLIAMYFVTMEISQGIETNKKVSRVASMVADLVTQQSSLTEAEIRAIMNIGTSTLQPYNRSRPRITVTQIAISDEANPKVTVVWSRKSDAGEFGIGAAAKSTTTVPSTLKVRGSYLIRVQTELSYKPVITWAASGKQTTGLSAAFDSISMSETYYLKARMSQRVDCSDCKG